MNLYKNFPSTAFTVTLSCKLSSGILLVSSEREFVRESQEHIEGRHKECELCGSIYMECQGTPV